MTAAITRQAITDGNLRTFHVAGPLGVVTYRPWISTLDLQPHYGRPTTRNDHANDELLAIALFGTDDSMFDALTRWHDALPPRPDGVPDATTGWWKLRGDDLCRAKLLTRWYPHPDDTIGGWAVMPVDLPPSCGVSTVASVPCDETATYIAQLHNDHLPAFREGIR